MLLQGSGVLRTGLLLHQAEVGQRPTIHRPSTTWCPPASSSRLLLKLGLLQLQLSEVLLRLLLLGERRREVVRESTACLPTTSSGGLTVPGLNPTAHASLTWTTATTASRALTAPCPTKHGEWTCATC